MSELNTRHSSPVSTPAFDAQESHLFNEDSVGSGFTTSKRLMLLGLAFLLLSFGLINYFSNFGVTRSKDKTQVTKNIQVQDFEPPALNSGQPLRLDPIIEKPLIQPLATTIPIPIDLEKYPEFTTLSKQYADIRALIDTQQAQDALELKSLQDQLKFLEQRLAEQNVLIHTLTTKNDIGRGVNAHPKMTLRNHPATKRRPATIPFKFLALDHWGDARLAQVVFKGKTHQLNEGEELAGWRFTGIDPAGQAAYFENALQVRILLPLP